MRRRVDLLLLVRKEENDAQSDALSPCFFGRKLCAESPSESPVCVINVKK